MAVEIASFDPGVTTGVTTLNGDEYKSFQIKPNQAPHEHEALWDLLYALQPKIIVYEKFLFRQSQTGVVYTGIEYIGLIKLYGQLNYIDYCEITPSQGKAFWNDRKIKALGLWVPGQPHAMDALRILLTYKMLTDITFKNETILKLRDVL